MRILVVEDEALIRMLICDLLEDAGHECLGAADAEHALLMLDQAPARPDLLVTDYNLGAGLDGMALAREVQARLPGLPTVFVTGNADCFADYPFQGGEALVAKPFCGATLVGAVTRVGALPGGADTDAAAMLRLVASRPPAAPVACRQGA